MKKLTQLLLAILLMAVAGSAAHAAPKKGIPANGELFYINGSQGRLAAKISLPELQQGERCPIVILSHGFGSNKEFYLWDGITAILNENGIGTLRFDFNGGGQSDGEFQNMTVPNENEDLLSVVAYAMSLPVTESISLVGHSQGGVVTSMVSGDCGVEQIKCEVLLSAAAVLREDAIRGITMGAHYDPWHLDQPYVELPSGLKLGRDYIQAALTLPIYETAEKYTGPALVINGMADQIVPFTYAQLYHKVLKNSELVLIPGEDHGYGNAPGFVVSLVTDWLIKQLKPAE